MSCKVEPWMWHVACEHWNQTFCNSNLNDKLNFTTIVTSFEVAANCIYFVTAKGQMSSGSFPLYCPANNAMYFKAHCTAHCNETSVNNILKDSSSIPDDEVCPECRVYVPNDSLTTFDFRLQTITNSGLLFCL